MMTRYVDIWVTLGDLKLLHLEEKIFNNLILIANRNIEPRFQGIKGQQAIVRKRIDTRCSQRTKKQF